MTTHRKAGYSRRSFLAGTGAVAAGLTFGPKFSLGAEEKKLSFYNWDTYIGETTLDDFGKASGIETKMDLYADNDELFAKLREGNPGYDVIIPTDSYVERMILANMIMPLDHGRIPNRKNIEPVFLDAAFDPGRKHSLPYMWGTLGIGYRMSKVDGVLEVALKYLGYSYNSKSAQEIKEAEALLIKQKPHVKVFAEDNGQDLLLSGEVDLTMEWNGDILQIMAEDDDISYVVPKEGSNVWQDCLCIPTGARHPENAHAFINFILEAEAGAAIADFIQYATPNNAARALLSDDYNKNPAIFPDDATLARCEAAIYLGEDVQRIKDEAWTRILAS